MQKNKVIQCFDHPDKRDRNKFLPFVRMVYIKDIRNEAAAYESN